MSLKITKLTKRFDEKTILSDFSCSFNETGVYAICGESGVGKTTLLRMIAGLDVKYRGEISGGGFSNTSFAFQEYRLFPRLKAYENVALAAFHNPTDADCSAAKDFLIKLGFTDAETELLPDELSGGMKQRVSISRAFLKNSPILILDEPTKELDRELRVVLLNLIAEEAKKRLVIFVSHNEDDISYLNAEIINL